MFYHILIESKENISTEYDLTKDNIIEEYVIPFHKKESVFIEGYNIAYKDIKRFFVSGSPISSEDVLSVAYSKIAPNVLYFPTKEEVVFIQKYDITRNLLKEVGQLNLNVKSQEDKDDINIENYLTKVLHKDVIRVSYQKFLDGHYSDSVESSMKELNTKLKRLYNNYRRTEKDGADLFAHVANEDENTLLLRFGDLSTEDGRNEQKGYKFLLMGAWFAIRNTKAHQNKNITKEEAVDRLIFVSMLIKRVDKAIEETFS